MEYRDYYKDLGLERNASADDIKKAFRSLARKYHPDANPNDPTAEENFKRISQANEVLSDPEKKAKYDALSNQYQQFKSQGGRGGNTSFDAFSQGGGQQFEGDLSDIFGEGATMSDFFEAMFGGGGGGRTRQRQPKPQQRIYSVTLSLAEAFTGVSKRLALGNEKIDITFKPGIADKQQLKIPQGILEVRIATDHRYVRDGNDLACTEVLPITTLVLGKKHPVQTLSGTAMLTIPAGTQPDARFRLRGLGMPVYGSSDKRGDFYVTVKAHIPTSLTDEERKLYEQLDKP